MAFVELPVRSASWMSIFARFSGAAGFLLSQYGIDLAAGSWKRLVGTGVAMSRCKKTQYAARTGLPEVGSATGYQTSCTPRVMRQEQPKLDTV